MGTIDVGELLYEYTVKLSGMTEYGVSFEALMAGTATPPSEGARFDVPFEGTSVGPKLKGKVTGVDYCASAQTADSNCTFTRRSQPTMARRSRSTQMVSLSRNRVAPSLVCARM